MRCEVWYHLYNLKNVKNTYGGVLVFVKLLAEMKQMVARKMVVYTDSQYIFNV